MCFQNCLTEIVSSTIYYYTSRKSAIPFGQGQSLNPYPLCYRWAFAFYSILYPPESSVFVASDLLRIIDISQTL